MRKSFKLALSLLIGVLSFNVALAQEFMLPNDVENLEATPKDGAVELTWDKSEDPDGVILGYKIYYGTSSVQTSDDSYADEILTGSSENMFVVSGLKNEVQYYFSVTAIDDEENESENYSLEVTAMPMPLKSDTPSVLSAEQRTAVEVEVKMSEAVTVKSLTNSFYIKERDNPREFVDLTTTKLNGDLVTLVVEAGSLKPSTTYVVTATSTVEDYEGKPVSSGITDTAEFVTKSAEVLEAERIQREEEVQRLRELEVQKQLEIEAQAQKELEAQKALELEAEKEQERWKAEQEAEAAAAAVAATSNPNDLVLGGDDSQETKVVSGMEDGSGEETHGTAFEQDKTPPLSVQEVSVDVAKFSGEGFVEISWNSAMDVEQDISDQILYTKEEGGEWDSGYSVGKETTDVELEVDPNKNYEVKIVTLDSSGNQSEGKVIEFSTKLMQSGSGTVVSFFLAFVVATLFLISRRRTC